MCLFVYDSQQDIFSFFFIKMVYTCVGMYVFSCNSQERTCMDHKVLDFIHFHMTVSVYFFVMFDYYLNYKEMVTEKKLNKN